MKMEVRKMSLGKIRCLAVSFLFQLALGAAAAEPALPMKIKSCDVKVDGGTVVIALGYASSKPLPESLLIVVSVKSENGEEILSLNCRKDQMLTVVPSTGQVLFTMSEYYKLKKKGANGTITMKLPERSWNVYDITGISAEMRIIVYEDKEGGGRKIGEIVSKKVRL
jgi:hypothetical protein